MQLKINTMLKDGAKLPIKAHKVDAGFDLFTPLTITVPSGGSAVVDTGVCFEIPEGYAGVLMSKSGLNVKFGLNGTGLIDSGYTGSIVAKLYNHSDADYTLTEGDKLIQIVFLPIPDVELEIVDKFKATERGDGGFGSTGK